MRIIVDTNLWISFTIGKRLSVLKKLVSRNDISIIISEDIIKEYLDVCKRPKFKKYISEADIEATLNLIDTYCDLIRITTTAISEIRDKDDLFLLSLADSCSADYIITGDNDLLILISHHQTKIIDFKTFQELFESVK